MMENYTPVQLKSYHIDNINFSYDIATLSKGEDINLLPKFDTYYKHIDDVNSELIFKVSIIGINENMHCFSLSLDMKAIFVFNNIEKENRVKFLKTACIASVFPYVRHAISDITSLSGIPNLVLPLMDMRIIGRGMKELKD